MYFRQTLRKIIAPCVLLALILSAVCAGAEGPTQEVLIDRVMDLYRNAPEDTIVWEVEVHDIPKGAEPDPDLNVTPEAKDLEQEEALRIALAAVLNLNEALTIEEVFNSYQVLFNFKTDWTGVWRFWVVHIRTAPGKLGTDSFLFHISSPEGRVVYYRVTSS